MRLHGPDSRNGGRPETRELVRELGLERWVSVRDAVYGREKWETPAVYPDLDHYQSLYLDPAPAVTRRATGDGRGCPHCRRT